MSPRPYRLDKRLAATEDTRGRIIAAARELLTSPAGGDAFTVDAVARKAGVARVTVYYQFHSRRGLIEALFDDLARTALVPHLPAIFTAPEPLEALDALVSAFAHFWASERVAIRRVRAFAALDPEIGAALAERDNRRIGHASRIIAQLPPLEWKPWLPPEELARALAGLTSFEHFDQLAGPDRTPTDVVPVVQRLARSLLGVRPGRPA
jgi:AcrR family transcriptional regulator